VVKSFGGASSGRAGAVYAFPPRKPLARRRFAASPRPARPSSIIAQVESSGTAADAGGGGLITGGGGGAIMGGASIALSEGSRVTQPVAPRRTSGTFPKNTSPKETSPALKPAHVPDWGAANHNSSVSPALLDASIIPTDGLTDRDALWLKAVGWTS
jgi:hypothetical protein